MNQQENKQKVRKFYDAIGWSKEDSGYYQNARYEDLRPVSAEYIHNCLILKRAGNISST